MEAPVERNVTLPETLAFAIAVDAYVYFYPLVLMDLTRRQLTNDREESGHAPMNTFANVPAYLPADFRTVTRANFDTLYSSAWLDLTNGPLIVSAPDTNGRYYLLPMLDMWSDVFASPGWRTTGTKAADFLITPPGWSGNTPDGLIHYPAPTPYVWVNGRTRTDGPADYPAVHAIQEGYKITPLSAWGKTPRPLSVLCDPTLDVVTPPLQQLEEMPGEVYFDYAAELLKLHPPHPTDKPILAEIKQIGIEIGHCFDISRLTPGIRRSIAAAPAKAHQLMSAKLPTLTRITNYWSMNTDTMGTYGNHYLKRAVVAQLSLGTNLPEDALYPLSLADDEGEPLHGANKYSIHFDQGGTPPARAFWSLTLYDLDGYQVDNALDRFALSSWMPFKFNADGSLDLYFQSRSPGKDKEANWLPAPGGPFNLVMRLYAPEAEALTGKWDPPPIKRVVRPEH
jgi:hypothetical protein